MSGHYIDWGTIPLDNIEKIEVLKGGSTARYGNNALDGVSNVVTKLPTEEATVSANLATGDIDLLQNYRQRIRNTPHISRACHDTGNMGSVPN